MNNRLNHSRHELQNTYKMSLLSFLSHLGGESSSSGFIVELAAASAILYMLGLGFYRLYLSPLASVPGPKLAALTGWVEAYYELFHGEGGQFMFKYREWHQKYGTQGEL